jgi:hypothetical protein
MLYKSVNLDEVSRTVKIRTSDSKKPVYNTRMEFYDIDNNYCTNIRVVYLAFVFMLCNHVK